MGWMAESGREVEEMDCRAETAFLNATMDSSEAAIPVIVTGALPVGSVRREIVTPLAEAAASNVATAASGSGEASMELTKPTSLLNVCAATVRSEACAISVGGAGGTAALASEALRCSQAKSTISAAAKITKNTVGNTVRQNRRKNNVFS